MRHAASRQLHAYWDALRGGRAAPGRDEIDPAAIRAILASVFVLDVGGPDEAAFGISGTRLDALFGRALRGTAFSAIWSARSVPLAAGALDAVVDGRRPASASARGGPPGRDAVDLELLMLPIAADGARRPPQALGCLAAFSAPGWMGLAAASPLEILPPRAIGGRPWAPPFAIRRGGAPAPARP